MRAKRRTPEIILRDGKPSAVIIDIGQYQGMLERLEDIEDLMALEEMRKRPLAFKKLTISSENMPQMHEVYLERSAYTNKRGMPSQHHPLFGSVI